MQLSRVLEKVKHTGTFQQNRECISMTINAYLGFPLSRSKNLGIGTIVTNSRSENKAMENFVWAPQLLQRFDNRFYSVLIRGDLKSPGVSTLQISDGDTLYRLEYQKVGS